MFASRVITVVGCHAEGEVGCVITGGVPPPPGDTLFAQKVYLEREGDGLRRFLLHEPRGGVFVHANLIVPAKTPGADAGFIVMEPTDYPPMSGSNSMCVATVLLETGIVTMREPETRLLLDTPGGLVAVVASCRDGRCERVCVRNAPSFVTHLDVTTEVPGLGTVQMDIAYGGAFFAIVDAHALGFSLRWEEARELVEVGQRIKRSAAEQHPVAHPETPDIHTVTFTEFAAPIERCGDDLFSRNAVVISPGKIDRSPCGTGTSARLAALHARGEAARGQRLINRSIIDSEFIGRIQETVQVGGHAGVVTTLSGRAWITGLHHYTLDPADPYPEGYRLSDTWPVPSGDRGGGDCPQERYQGQGPDMPPSASGRGGA